MGWLFGKERSGLKIHRVWGFVALLLIASCSRESGPEYATAIGLDEKLGAMAPLDLSFRDEQGNAVVLRDVLQGPTLVCFVYFRCPGICSPLLTDLADLLAKTDQEPGLDFKVLTVSIDPTETPETAAGKRKSYLGLVRQKRAISDDAWRFFTGEERSIASLTEALGFRYQKVGNEYQHAGAGIMLARDGKVIRYLYGKNFVPFDLKMAVAEASKGEPGFRVSRVLLLCFSYDPAGRKYAFNILRVAGAVIVLLAGCFFLYLVVQRRKPAES